MGFPQDLDSHGVVSKRGLNFEGDARNVATGLANTAVWCLGCFLHFWSSRLCFLAQPEGPAEGDEATASRRKGQAKMKEKLGTFGLLLIPVLRGIWRFMLFVHDKCHRIGAIRFSHDTDQNLLIADSDLILR